MSKFENVTVVKAANIYYDGKVTSRVVEFANGDIKTLGIMMPGEYHFGTEKKEITGGDSFEVPANSGFDIKIKTVVDYCCSYIG